jgi:hypothetical protein
MHIYNKVHVLLSTLSYMFRRLLRHLQGELYRTLRTTVTLFGPKRDEVTGEWRKLRA